MTVTGEERVRKGGVRGEERVATMGYRRQGAPDSSCTCSCMWTQPLGQGTAKQLQLTTAVSSHEKMSCLRRDSTTTHCTQGRCSTN